MKLDITYVAVAILMIECTCTQEPKESRCVGGYELSFFYGTQVKKSNPAARQACSNYHNSSLVKVDNHSITSVIDSVIKIDKFPIHIDGSADSNRSWTWSDGSKIYLRNETGGYQNWYSNQPNDQGRKEDCIIVGRGTTKWKDSRCDEELGYICQRDLDPCIMVDSSNPNIHKCVATGSTEPQVEWRKDGRAVTTNPYQRIYQTKFSNDAALYYESATIDDGGKYVCAAWIGVREKLSNAVEIKVNGKPSIIEVISFKCNSSLLVLWKPSRSALKFPHKIIAIGSKHTVNVTVTPTKRVEFTQITGLQADTEYSIQISACVKNDTCTADHQISKTTITNGKAKRVANVSLTQLTKINMCTISWNWPYEMLKNVTAKFVIKLLSGSPVMLKTIKISLVKSNHGRYSYSFEPLKNLSYMVKVQSVRSMKSCDMVSAVGSCVGKDINSTTVVAVSLTVGILSAILVAVFVVLWKRKNSKRTKETVENNSQSDGANVDMTYENCASPEYCNIPVYENVGTSAVRPEIARENNAATAYENVDQRTIPSSIYEN